MSLRLLSILAPVAFLAACSGADEKLILTPPVQITLEKAIEYIADDELVEITPTSIRLRKKALAGNMRSVKRGERDDD